jgi:hypothetical protein
MCRLLSLLTVGLFVCVARAEDRVSWEITPRVTAPGQPFRLQIQVESDVVLGGAQNVGKEIKPPRGMALRLSGQIIRPDSTEATLNFSGVAPDQEGEYIIPSFNLRFARKIIVAPEVKLIVSKTVNFRRSEQARAELEIPRRTFFVGELIHGAINMYGGESEGVVASFGLESVAEGFTFQISADRQPLPVDKGQGLQTTFDLTPIREGENEIAINGIMLIQAGEVNAFSTAGRDRPFAFRRRISVEHVPEKGRPADWSGAIGKFTVETVQVSNEKPEVGEPIRLRAVLTGAGNLDRIVPPELASSEIWDVLPAVERRRHAEEQRFFVYTLVPRLPGKHATPAIHFSVFNPETRTYSRLDFPAQEVTVTGNAPAKVDLVNADPAAPVGGPGKISGLATPQPRQGATFLRTQGPVAPLAASRGFWSGNLLALLATTLTVAILLYAGYLAAHPEILIRRRARAIVKTAQTATSEAQRRGDAHAAAIAAVGGLQAGCAALLGAEPEAMTQSDVQRVFPGANREDLDILFAHAHAGRFGAQSGNESATAREVALSLLRQLHKML